MWRFGAAALALLIAGCSDAARDPVGPKGPSRDITGITVNCNPTVMAVGSSGYCSAWVTYTSGTYVPPVDWWSTNPSVVQVVPGGTTYAVGYGTATIYGAEGAYVSGVTITVPAPMAPLAISISGPTSITREGTYTWYAQASNQVSGESVSYTWQVSTDGGASWTQVSTTSSYSRSLTSGSPSFQLRLTSTSNAYRTSSTSTATASVSVANPLLPPALGVTVAGPDYISTAGTYQWTAYPSGGVPGYSYVWEKSTDGGSTWSTLLSTRYTYPIYTQTAEMSFTCGTSTTLRYRAKVTSSDGQVAYGYRTTSVYIPSC